MTEAEPYRPPKAPLTDDAQSSAGRPTEEELRSFVGETRDAMPAGENYYLPRWLPLMEHGGGFAGFNWAAAFWTVPWLVYRKMYRFAVVFWIATMLFAAGTGLLLDEGIGRVLLLQLAGFCVGGLLGNMLYYRQATRIILQLRSTAADHERAALLAARGGTSGLALGIVLVIVLLILPLMTLTGALATLPQP